MKDLLRSLFVQIERFLWSSPAVTRSAPHIRDANNVQRMWNYFVIASVPACLMGLWSLGHQTNLAISDFQIEAVPGWRALVLSRLGFGFDASSIADCFFHGLLYFLPVLLVALVAGALWEAIFATLRKKPVDEGLLAIAWLFQTDLRRFGSLPGESGAVGSGIPGVFLSCSSVRRRRVGAGCRI
jgi:Na+-transporting NADH:ubiquinone oxidoreductase subunit B